MCEIIFENYQKPCGEGRYFVEEETTKTLRSKQYNGVCEFPIPHRDGINWNDDIIWEKWSNYDAKFKLFAIVLVEIKKVYEE